MGAYGSTPLTFLKDATPTGSCSQALGWGKLPGMAVYIGDESMRTAVKIGMSASYMVDGVLQSYVAVYVSGVRLSDPVAASRVCVLSNLVSKAIQLGGIRHFKLVLLDTDSVAVNPAATISMRLIYNETR